MPHTCPMVEYSSVKIPVSFKERFERMNEEYDLGYASLAEFVKESMRKRFEEIRATHQGN